MKTKLILNDLLYMKSFVIGLHIVRKRSQFVLSQIALNGLPILQVGNFMQSAKSERKVLLFLVDNNFVQDGKLFRFPVFTMMNKMLDENEPEIQNLILSFDNLNDQKFHEIEKVITFQELQHELMIIKNFFVKEKRENVVRISLKERRAKMLIWAKKNHKIVNAYIKEGSYENKENFRLKLVEDGIYSSKTVPVDIKFDLICDLYTQSQKHNHKTLKYH